MTKLTDLFGAEGCGCAEDFTLEAMLAAGYVRAQRHPSLPLTIYNYTPKTQFEKAWNAVTKQCRGLIVHDDGTVVARPFPKFFNWGETPVEGLNRDAPVTVTDKADGSLGILYPTPGIGNGWSVATRGSFTSDQAIEASIMLSDLYPRWEPPASLGPVTVLFEIIYPQNRIVLDYGRRRELRLIDALWIDTGWPIGSDPTVVAEVLGWPGPVVEHLGTLPLKEALHRLVGARRENREGVVLRFLDTDDRYKIKQDDYVALHRVLTGTSARTVWSYLAVRACRDLVTEPKHWQKIKLDPTRAQQILALGDDPMQRLLENVPDEFYDWVYRVSERIQREVADTQHLLESILARAQHELLVRETTQDNYREHLYRLLSEESLTHVGAAMALYDGKDQTWYCWKQAYPGVELPFWTRTEDVA